MKKNLLIAALTMACCLMGSTKAFALGEKDGVYQIGNAADLEEFSNMVASGNGGLNAVLTADIDMTGVAHQPIGTTGSSYSGSFDGQQHFIMNMSIDLPEQEYVGLFGVLSNGAYIKNVIVDWSCSIVGSAFVGGIAGGTNGGGSVTFENCGNEGNVGAQNQNAAGICGVSMNSACGIKMIHCFNSGGISGDRECASLCGWVGDSGSAITNCYNSGYVIGMDGTNSLWRNGNGKGTNNYDAYGYQGTLISQDDYDLSSGAVCYQINGNQSDDVTWFQRLNEDLHPVPFSSHGIVYAVGDLNCDGSSKGGDLSFSNTNASNRDPHKFVDGICSVCGDVDYNYKPLTADNFYELSTPADLNWLAALVNHGAKNVNVRLMTDIDFSEYTQKDVMIGGNAYTQDETFAFEGVFDGLEHAITVNFNASYDGVGLFKVIENATVKNLIVKGNIETTQRYAGGLSSVARGTTLIENVIVAVNITGSYPGDATHGGILAIGHEHPTLRNCAFVGSMNAPDSEGSAAIIGYAHGSVETRILNTYVAPQLMSLTGNSTIIARHVDNIVNCFFTDNIVSLWDDAATMVSQEAVATGELAYKLNEGGADGGWRQTLGSDEYPVPFSSHLMVYANGTLNCDGTPKGDISYSNTQGEPQRDAHQYQNDICSVCGARIIRNGAQLKALADDINQGIADGNIIVDLDADIDMKGIAFEGIGTRFTQPIDEESSEDVKRPFTGYFDGHGHHIQNMVIDAQEGNKGLFGLASGATIKNVIVDNSCEIYSTGYSAGIVGTAMGRATITIENCGNEALVNVGVDGVNGAGILGVNDLSEAFVRIINCYNTGDIIGQRECGAISGWLGDRAEVINTYNSGTVAPGSIDGDRTFARYNGSGVTFTNCYEVDGRQVTAAEAADVVSGKLCYMLNEGAGATIYYQTLGSDLHPVLDASHKKVVMEGNDYVNEGQSGIEEVHSAIATTTATQIYDMQGRKVNSATKSGLYIVNGKKYLVK